MTDFASKLMAAAEEAAAHMRGEDTGAVVHHFPDPKAIREKRSMTQAELAQALGMSLSGYRKLEQGQRAVSGPIAILLRIFEVSPDTVIAAAADQTATSAR